jgi:tRNA guanosine-2'-O-methyltransferase
MLQGGPLPCSVMGKLGGPSQRRLATFSSTTPLQAIISVKAVTSVVVLCGCSEDALVGSAVEFLWSYTWKVIILLPPDTETEAEVQLAAHEALTDVLGGLSASFLLVDVHDE